MSTENPTKINQLLHSQPPGTVFLSSWLADHGYSLDLQKKYRHNKWLESIGNGAMIRAGDLVSYEGALYALQQQSGLTIHPGGRTAFSILGKAQYLELAASKIVLFGQSKESLPAWFLKHNWGLEIAYHTSSFIPPNLGITSVELKNFSIHVSSPVRALMECLYLAPEHQDLMECFELMECMNNLRPNLVQQLLEECHSVKVKRLFLYLAEKAGHEWLKHIDMQKINLGRGKRSVFNNGVYIPKYQITVTKTLESNGKQHI